MNNLHFYQEFCGFHIIHWTEISLALQLIFPINDISKTFTGPCEDFCPKRHQVCWAPWEAPPDQEEVCGPWGSQTHLHRSVLQRAGPEQHHWYTELKTSWCLRGVFKCFFLFLSQDKILISLLPQLLYSTCCQLGFSASFIAGTNSLPVMHRMYKQTSGHSLVLRFPVVIFAHARLGLLHFPEEIKGII